MAKYRIYWVTAAKVKPGKGAEAVKWWKEKGAPDILSDPWIKSLRCFTPQFGLGGTSDFEIWREIESYAAFDEIDKFYEENPEIIKQKYDGIWKEGEEYIEWGPSRLMGDWPESSVDDWLLPEEK